MEEGLVVLRRRGPSRSRSRNPACRQPRSPSTPPPTQLLTTTQGSFAARDEISQVLEAVDDTIEAMMGDPQIVEGDRRPRERRRALVPTLRVGHRRASIDNVWPQPLLVSPLRAHTLCS